MYQFTIMHIPGKTNLAPDTASRYPTKHESQYHEDEEKEEHTNRECSQAFATGVAKSITAITWSDVSQAAICDEECVALLRQISKGFPDNRALLPEQIRGFWPMKDELYAIEIVPFNGCRMLIPKILRRRVLEGLHVSHQGVTGMLGYAKSRFFWPGMDAAIRLYRAQCKQCNTNAPSQPSEPIVVTQLPEMPFQQTVADLCDLEGHTFLIYADRYSGWVEGTMIRNGKFSTIRRHLLSWFVTFGAPEEISTDGGPPFNSTSYEEFLKQWGIQRRLSSAYYPQSNGRAEVAVKSIKRILSGNINSMTGEIDTDAAAVAIMSHRNTPNQETGISPADTLFGYALRDHLPDKFREIRREWADIKDAREIALAKRHIRTDTRQSSRELPQLLIGDAVSIQNQCGNKPLKWDSTGLIAEAMPHRQYRVVVDGSRRVTLRNRRFLRKIDPVCRQPRDILAGLPRTEPLELHCPTPAPTDSTPPLLSETTSKVTAPSTVVPQNTTQSTLRPSEQETTPSADGTPVNGIMVIPALELEQPSEGALPPNIQPRRSMRSRRPPQRLDL